MAKRFTDTDKWKRPWFGALPPMGKLVWFYILDNADHCGVWHADFRLLEFQTGVSVTREAFESWFNGKFVRLDDDKYFFPSFVVFQQGKLSEAKNAHKPILEFLAKYGLSLSEPEPQKTNLSGSHPDPILMGPGKGISKGKGKSEEGGVGETNADASNPPRQPDFQPKVRECIEDWKATLVYFERDRPLIPGEDVQIAAACLRWGPDNVLMAFKGARQEPKGKDYDPANYVSLDRYLDPKKFKRFVSLGVGEATVSDGGIDWGKVKLS